MLERRESDYPRPDAAQVAYWYGRIGERDEQSPVCAYGDHCERESHAVSAVDGRFTIRDRAVRIVSGGLLSTDADVSRLMAREVIHRERWTRFDWRESTRGSAITVRRADDRTLIRIVSRMRRNGRVLYVRDAEVIAERFPNLYAAMVETHKAEAQQRAAKARQALADKRVARIVQSVDVDALARILVGTGAVAVDYRDS